jgi:hypothetical protein
MPCANARRACLALFAAGLIAAAMPSAKAGTEFRLIAQNVSFDTPAPLFTSSTVSGELTLAGTVGPGDGFGLADIQDFAFNFGGIPVTLAETLLPGGDITAFGSVAADGASISLLDLRYDLPATVASCGLICAGQIEIGTFDNSNFVAIDDPNAATTSLVQFDAALVSAPEPGSLAILGMALGSIITMRRRGRS